jgi:hypothetical protein
MYEQIFNESDLDTKPDLQLQRTINASGCSVRVDNQSKYAIDVYVGQSQFDRINPYSFLIVPNGDYTIKVNKSIVSQNVQANDYISYKTVDGEVKTDSGSTTFTGTANVAGDMNVTGGQIDAYIQGDINLAPGTEVNATVTGDINLAPDTLVNANVTNIVETNTTITNATVPIEAPNGIDVNIQNASVPITGNIGITSGTVNATIENAQLNSNIVNASLKTNKLVQVLSDYKYTFTIAPGGSQLGTLNPLILNLIDDMGLYDTFVFRINAYADWLTPVSGQTHTDVYLKYFQINSASFKQIPIASTISYGNVRSQGYNAGGWYVNFAQNVLLTEEEPLDLFNMSIQYDATQAPTTQSVTVSLEIDIYAYNSSPFNQGVLTLQSLVSLANNMIFTNGKGAIDLYNSDITGVNSIVLNDASNSATTEGVLFPKSTAPVKSTNANDYDNLRVLDGKLYITSDIAYERELTALSNVDLNTLTVNKTFYAITPINKPSTASASTGFVRHYQRSGGYAIQWYETSVNTFEIWCRRLNNNVWEAWKKVTIA